jgi:phage-related minor tail protein
LARIWNVPIVYTEQFAKRSNEVGENTMSAIDVNNDIAVKSLDAIAENLKVFNRAIDSFAEYTTSASQAWNSFYAVQRQPPKH